MAHVAVIVGISDVERFLAPNGTESWEEKGARRFRSPETAKAAAQAHIKAFPPVIQRYMKFRVEPRA